MVESTETVKTLLHCYEFSDYQVEEWLTEMLNCPTNAEFKASVDKNEILIKINDHFKEMYETHYAKYQQNDETKHEAGSRDVVATVPLLDEEEEINMILEDLETFIKQLIEDHAKDEKSFMSMLLLLFSFYIRENHVGPSVYTEYIEETLEPRVKGFLPAFTLDPISNKNKHLQGALLKHFDKDGECLYHKSQFLVFLFWIEIMLTDTDVLPIQSAPVRAQAMLWRARLKFQLDLHLSSSVCTLKDASIGLYKEYTQ